MKLTARTGPLSGNTFQVTQPVTRIGRAANNECVILDERLSRHHAEIRRDPRGWFLIDLGSTNGTLVNGVRIRQPYLLRSGDQIVIGQSTLLVSEIEPGRAAPSTARKRVALPVALMATVAVLLIAVTALLVLLFRDGASPPEVSQALATTAVTAVDTASLSATKPFTPTPEPTSMPTLEPTPTHTPQPTLTLQPTPTPTIPSPTPKPTNTPKPSPPPPPTPKPRQITHVLYFYVGLEGCPYSRRMGPKVEQLYQAYHPISRAPDRRPAGHAALLAPLHTQETEQGISFYLVRVPGWGSSESSFRQATGVTFPLVADPGLQVSTSRIPVVAIHNKSTNTTRIATIGDVPYSSLRSRVDSIVAGAGGSPITGGS